MFDATIELLKIGGYLLGSLLIIWALGKCFAAREGK